MAKPFELRFTNGELMALIALIKATQEDKGWAKNYLELQRVKNCLPSALAKLEEDVETRL